MVVQSDGTEKTNKKLKNLLIIIPRKQFPYKKSKALG